MKVMVEKEDETLPRDLPTSLARDTHAMARQNPFGAGHLLGFRRLLFGDRVAEVLLSISIVVLGGSTAPSLFTGYFSRIAAASSNER